MFWAHRSWGGQERFFGVCSEACFRRSPKQAGLTEAQKGPFCTWQKCPRGKKELFDPMLKHIAKRSKKAPECPEEKPGA